MVKKKKFEVLFGLLSSENYKGGSILGLSLWFGTDVFSLCLDICFFYAYLYVYIPPLCKYTNGIRLQPNLMISA